MGSLTLGNVHNNDISVRTPFLALESTFTSKSYTSLTKERQSRLDSGCLHVPSSSWFARPVYVHQDLAGFESYAGYSHDTWEKSKAEEGTARAITRSI